MATMIEEAAAAVHALVGESVDDLTFAALVDLALAGRGRRLLEDAEPEPTYVVADGWRLWSNGERSSDR